MSKQKVQSQPTVQVNKLKQALDHLAKLAKANGKRLAVGKGTHMLVFALLFFILALLEHHAKGLIFGALYAFANDGVISGRQSNSVKTRNGIERMFVVPRLVQNAHTAAARALPALYSSLWSSLTDENRATWLNVGNVFRSNRLGRQIPTKGKALFVERNVNLFNAGQTPLTDYLPSEGVSTSVLTGGSVVTTTGTITAFTVDFDPTPTDGNTTHLVFATAPLPAGVSRPSKSAFRLIATITSGSTSPANILTKYASRFGGGAIIDQKIGVRFVAIDNATGQAGVASEAILAVT